jgi:polysaccharide deacetylase 2 family uncharacterized protein YibQ
LKKKKKQKKSPRKKNTEGIKKVLFNSLLLLSFSILLISVIIFTYAIFKEKQPNSTKPTTKTTEEQEYDKLMKKMNKIINQTLIVPKELPLETEDYEYSNKILEKKIKPLPPIPKKHSIKKPKQIYKKQYKKPKLAIIIDDISNQKEINELNKAHLKLTYSIFPPTSTFPNTPKIAKKLDFYMIHLPLEAYHFNRPQEQTLTTNNSKTTVFQRIKTIRKLFPKAKFLNNHTGSKFTDNQTSMEYLLSALKKYHFHFLDSKTIASSKAEIVAKKYQMKILKRDIFIDNEPDIKYILNQLKKAVNKAKQKGYAIAIGHPRIATIKALRKAKNVLKGVRVVYVKELF